MGITTTETGHPLYQGEVLLTNWSETASRGMTVSFALNAIEEGETHPFRGLGTGKHGQRFMLVAVPIDEQNEVAEGGTLAVATPQPEAEDRDTPRRKFEDMQPSQQAGLLCADEAFHLFLMRATGGAWGAVHCDMWPKGDNQPTNADVAARIVREWCGIKSRSELNSNAEALETWRGIVCEYRDWQALSHLPEQRG